MRKSKLWLGNPIHSMWQIVKFKFIKRASFDSSQLISHYSLLHWILFESLWVQSFCWDRLDHHRLSSLILFCYICSFLDAINWIKFPRWCLTHCNDNFQYTRNSPRINIPPDEKFSHSLPYIDGSCAIDRVNVSLVIPNK